MPFYPYFCEQGHESEAFFHMKDDKPGSVACETCGRPAKRAIVVPIVNGDIPEHYNPSLGTAVRGRTHLKSLQRELGTSDYEPSPKMKERLAESKAKILHASGRGAHSVGG